MASPRAMSVRMKSLPGDRLKAAFGSYRAADMQRARPIVRDGSGDRHADDFQRRITRELARDLDRSSGLYTAAVTAFLDLVIGGGVLPEATTKDPKFNEAVKALVKYEYLDSKALDVEGVDTMPALQRKWARAVVNDGDAALVKYNGQLQTIESDRIDGPTTGNNQHVRTTSGVQCQVSTGKRLGAWIAPYDKAGQCIVASGAEFYQWDSIIWMGSPNRKSQVRSMPALVASLDDAERAESLIESEIISAEQASQIWGFITDPDDTAAGGPSPLAPLNADGTVAVGGFANGANTSGTNIPFTDFVAGTLGFMGKRTLQQMKTERPNLNVPEFVKAVVRIFIASLGVPYELAFLDVGSLSWSGNKALLAFCERRLQVWREQVFGPAFSDIYRWRVRSWIARGLLPDIPDWDSHVHHWPLPPATDGPDQVKTDEGNIALGKTNLHRLNGPGWKRIVEERGEEIAVACAQAAKIVAEYPDSGVTWRDFIGGPSAAGQPKQAGGDTSSAPYSKTPAKPAPAADASP